MNEIVDFIRENKIKVAIAVPSGYLLANRLVKGYRQNQMKSAIREHKLKCERDFDVIENKLKQFSLDQKERQRIFNLTSVELQQELKNGRLSPLDVLQVYQLQVLEANKTINAITEPLLDARALADALDPNSPDKGGLFGIPISVKENYQLTGKTVTVGLVQLLDKINTEDAVLVQVIKSQGAIPFVRTNIPQTMMTYESSNPIYGKTNNPFDLKRSSGGSSSGEAALIGCGASVIGLGGDIGGSIRVPCHFCGCYGLKPTSERLSRKGTFSLSGGQTVVKGSNGPMSRDFEGLVITMKALLCDLHFQLDPEVPPIKFRDELYECTKPLTIGFYVNDGFTQAVPAVQRAVLLAKQALEAQGHTVVEFTPPRLDYAIPELYIASVSGDRGEQFKQYLRKDVVDPTVRDLMRPTTIPKWSTWLLSWLFKNILGDKKTAHVLNCRNGKSSVFQWFQQALKVQAYKEEFLKAWQEQKLDAVICPPFACTAIPHGDVMKVILAGSYSLLYNVVNYPAGVVPVTKVMAGDVLEMKDYPKSTLLEKSIHKVTVGSEGLPVGVQCVSLPFQEELVLRVMREVRDGLQKMKSS